jgi:hypothetical protein
LQELDQNTSIGAVREKLGLAENRSVLKYKSVIAKTSGNWKRTLTTQVLCKNSPAGAACGGAGKLSSACHCS